MLKQHELSAKNLLNSSYFEEYTHYEVLTTEGRVLPGVTMRRDSYRNLYIYNGEDQKRYLYSSAKKNNDVVFAIREIKRFAVSQGFISNMHQKLNFVEQEVHDTSVNGSNFLQRLKMKATFKRHEPSDYDNAFRPGSFQWVWHDTFTTNIDISPSVVAEDYDTFIKVGNKVYKDDPSYKKFPQQCIYVVVRFIEDWCRTKGEEWDFATVKFAYTWDSGTENIIIATCKELSYVLTRNGTAISFCTETTKTIKIPCEIDEEVFKRTKQDVQYREHLLNASHSPTTSLSLNHRCDTTSILQRFGECWYIAAVVLLSKCLFKELHKDIQIFLKVYQQHTQPVSTRGSSLIIPPRVARLYRSGVIDFVNKERDNIPTYEYEEAIHYKDYIASFITGGTPEIFLQTIMTVSNIAYHSHSTPKLTQFPNESSLFYDVNDDMKYLCVSYNFELVDSKVRIRDGLDDFLKLAIESYAKKGHMILGGQVCWLDYKSSVGYSGHHVIPFSVCGDKTILCNYGKCIQSTEDDPTIFKKVIDQVIFLIQLNTIETKEEKTQQVIQMNENFRTVKLLSKCVVLTVTCDRIIEEKTIEGKIIDIDNFCGTNLKWEPMVKHGDVLEFRRFGMDHVVSPIESRDNYLQIVSINGQQPWYSLMNIKWTGNQSIFSMQRRYKSKGFEDEQPSTSNPVICRELGMEDCRTKANLCAWNPVMKTCSAIDFRKKDEMTSDRQISKAPTEEEEMIANRMSHELKVKLDGVQTGQERARIGKEHEHEVDKKLEDWKKQKSSSKKRKFKVGDKVIDKLSREGVIYSDYYSVLYDGDKHPTPDVKSDGNFETGDRVHIMNFNKTGVVMDHQYLVRGARSFIVSEKDLRHLSA